MASANRLRSNAAAMLTAWIAAAPAQMAAAVLCSRAHGYDRSGRGGQRFVAFEIAEWAASTKPRFLVQN